MYHKYQRKKKRDCICENRDVEVRAVFEWVDLHFTAPCVILRMAKKGSTYVGGVREAYKRAVLRKDEKELFSKNSALALATVLLRIFLKLHSRGLLSRGHNLLR